MDLPFSNCRLDESNLRSFQALIWVTHPQSDDFLSWMPVQYSASSHFLSVPRLTFSQISPCPTRRTLMAFKARVHATWPCEHFKYPEVFVKIPGGFQSIFIPGTPFQTLKMCCYTHMNECIPYFMTWNCTFLVLSTVVKGLPQWLSSKEPTCNAAEPDSISGQEDPLEKKMATYSSFLAWKIQRTVEPGGLQSTGHNESDTTERLNNNKCNNNSCQRFQILKHTAFWA